MLLQALTGHVDSFELALVDLDLSIVVLLNFKVLAVHFFEPELAQLLVPRQVRHY
jgi:hypothetical protein